MTARCLLPHLLAVLTVVAQGAPANGEGGVLQAAATPILFWASSPVLPNETVLLAGADLSAATSCHVCAASGAACVSVPNVDPRADSMKCTIPSSVPLDVFTAAACDGAVCSPPTLINAPAVMWQQADVGAHEASVGGEVRLFGAALAFTSNACAPTGLAGAPAPPPATTGARVRLTPLSGGEPILLPLTRASCFALTASVPLTTPPGSYVAEISNGLPSSPWVPSSSLPLRISVLAPWPSTVFDVTTAGGVWGALAAAEKAGGGVVFFPRGRYAFDDNHTLSAIPPYTTLQGEGTDLVELYWRDTVVPPTSSKTALIQGTSGHYAVRNLTIFSHGNISSSGVISDNGFDGLRVSGVVIRSNPYYMMLEPVNTPFHGRSMPVGSGAATGPAIAVSGANWRVEDCDVLGGSHAISIFVSDAFSPTWYGRSRNGVLARNTLEGGFGIYRCEGVDGVVMEDNVMRGAGLNAVGSWISTYYAKATSHLYFARNRVSTIMGGDRELLSFDGGGGAYGGGVAATSADGLTLTLSADPTFAGYIPPGPRLFNYTEAAVCVMGGRGAGQVRRVVSNDYLLTNRSWVLDAPFDVELDSTSFISIVPFRGDMIIAGNSFSDGGAIQLYAMAINTIVAECDAVRTSGFLAWGLNPHGWGAQPNFRVQFFDNTVRVGNAWGGQTGGFGTVSSSSPTDGGPMNRAVIFRRNTVMNNAPIAIGGNTEDVVVEHCSVADNAVGVTIGNTTVGVFVRGTTCEGVAQCNSTFLSYAPALHCCCNATDPYTLARAVVKPFTSYSVCASGDCEAPGVDAW